jgi:hypothetical protein
MRDTYYFSHDYNARTDSKIKRLIARHGLTGYGIYWAIVEDLYQNANALPTDYEGIAFDIRSDAETVKSIVNDFDLFKVDADLFGSLSVQRRLDEREQKSTKARDSARKRWDKDANALPTQSDRNAIKGKERKGKEKKGEESNEALPPPSPHPLIVWIAKNAPRVQQLKQPLTNDEAQRIMGDLAIDNENKKQRLRDLLISMENYKPLLTKSVSANLTIRKWWKSELERTGEVAKATVTPIKMNTETYTR